MASKRQIKLLGRAAGRLAMIIDIHLHVHHFWRPPTSEEKIKRVSFFSQPPTGFGILTRNRISTPPQPTMLVGVVGAPFLSLGFESVARPSAVGFVLGLHGTIALPEMTDRKGTAVVRPVGGRWRSCSPVKWSFPPVLSCSSADSHDDACGPRALPRFRYC